VNIVPARTPTTFTQRSRFWQTDHIIAWSLASYFNGRARRDQINKQIGWHPFVTRRKLEKLNAASADMFGGVADEYHATSRPTVQLEPLGAPRVVRVPSMIE
jgi:hypothetical protein